MSDPPIKFYVSVKEKQFLLRYFIISRFDDSACISAGACNQDTCTAIRDPVNAQMHCNQETHTLQLHFSFCAVQLHSGV